MRATATGGEECAVAAVGIAEARLDGIAALRKNPGPTGTAPLPPAVLKFSDELTVLGTSALLRASEHLSQPLTQMGDWGVVAAPRYFGRLGASIVMDRYRAEGSRGAPPMTIPNLSLHATSGTISLAFQFRGPNFGVGGGPGSLAEGLLAGLSLQLEDHPPGTWVVVGEWEPEPTTAPNAACQAVALALVDVADAPTALRLRLDFDAAPKTDGVEARVSGLVDFLNDWTAGRRHEWCCPLDWGARLVLAGGSKP